MILKIIEVGTSLIGLIGGILGLISWNQTRKIQKYTVEDIEKARRETVEEDVVFDALCEKVRNHSGGVPIWNPEIGSDEHKVFERLVSKGKLTRRSMGFTMNHKPWS